MIPYIKNFSRKIFYTKVVEPSVSEKEGISQNLKEKTCARVSFLIKLQAVGQRLY